MSALSSSTITPLGAGQQVGRSCILQQYMGKNIMVRDGVGGPDDAGCGGRGTGGWVRSLLMYGGLAVVAPPPRLHSPRAWRFDECALTCMYACMHACMYACVRVCACVLVYMRACVCEYVRVYWSVCVRRGPRAGHHWQGWAALAGCGHCEAFSGGHRVHHVSVPQSIKGGMPMSVCVCAPVVTAA